MWGDIYTKLVMVTGWTWEYIDEFVTIPRLLEMSAYWRKSPPLHELVAAFVGYGDKSSAVTADEVVRMDSEENAAAFVRAFQQAGGLVFE